MELRTVLRERNQMTLPDALVERWAIGPDTPLLISLDEAAPDRATIRPLLKSYAGIARGVYGENPEAVMRYIAEERASDSVGSGAAGYAGDGTPYLTLEESRRAHPELSVTRDRYQKERWLRWPLCDMCGRAIARMHDHMVKHRTGVIDDAGLRTDEAQRERSRRRVAKYRATRRAVAGR